MPTKIPAINVDWEAVREELAPYLQREPEFAERFAQLPTLHAKRKPDLLAQVVSWEYRTFGGWALDPSHFLLDGYLRPGRRLKEAPACETKALRYGLDGEGRFRVEYNRSNSEESFWDYYSDRIDGMAVSTNSPPDSKFFRHHVESLFLEKGRPVWYFTYAGQAKRLRLFRYQDELIVRVLSACKSESLRAIGHPSDRWLYELADIQYDGKGTAHVRCFDDFRDAGYAHVYKMPKVSGTKIKIPVLDLRKDVADTVAALAKAVKSFAARQAKSPGPVSGIGLGFFVFENPEIIIRFDTRPIYKPDGEWSHPEFARLKRPQWSRFFDACEEANGTGSVIDVHGQRQEIADVSMENRFVSWLGDAMVVALRTARDTGAFEGLQTATRCELGVEEAADGEFGWPRYEDRGKENLL